MLDLLNRLGQPQVASRPELSKQAFKGVQREMLERIALLAESIYEQKRSALIVLEGWDAAGKGTTIRTLTARLDARGYKVLATQAPRTHEKQKPWLWRFWMNIPRYGQIAIFDRSWYGRVLVERVYGLTPVPEWIAAYEEINQFERTLADDGTIILKFWLHISKEEQLRRFVALAQQEATAWQVTAEDWENHRRYDEFVAAVRDMLANTNTPCAPWAVIDAASRQHCMYNVCRALIERLETSLGVEHSHWPAPEELEAAADIPQTKRPKERGDKREDKNKDSNQAKKEKKDKQVKQDKPAKRDQKNKQDKKQKKQKEHLDAGQAIGTASTPDAAAFAAASARNGAPSSQDEAAVNDQPVEAPHA
jgi:polyphosphate kinase 2 (PPK2 family)